MFKIYDGRDQFFQWDLNRKLIVNDPTVKQVHFCNKTDNCSLVVEVYEEDGLYLADVPNILLQSDWNIRVYGYDSEYTKHYAVYKVQSRTKPTDYVYTETEVKSWEDLDARIKELESASGSDCYSKEETDELLLDKVDKEEGKGLSTNDFTTYLRNKLIGLPFDVPSSPIETKVEFEEDGQGEGWDSWRNKTYFNQFYHGLNYITGWYIYSGGGDYQETALLLCDGYEDGGSHVNRLLIASDGEVYKNRSYPSYNEDTGEEETFHEEWEKISVSQYDLSKYVSTKTFNDTIGDIQSLLDNTIALADSYINGVSE